MLHRTKYSRLRNDSVTSLEDGPWSAGPLKLGAKAAPPAAPDPPVTLAPPHPSRPGSPWAGATTLCAFIPRMSGIRISSPASLLGLKGLGPKPASRNQPGAARHPTACHSPPGTERISGSLKEAGAGTDWRNPECGTTYQIKYMGCLEVIQSMRALDFETRMQVTREAIGRLCESTAGAKTAFKRRKTPSKGLSTVLGKSNLQFSGINIKLDISTNSLKLTTLDSLQTIAHHPMQSISFASGGDPDTADYVAYVAKDSVNQRACHILECPEGLAQEVINAIGQAFERCFRQFLSNTSSLMTTQERAVESHDRHGDSKGWALESTDCHVYYNEIPGKEPPPGGLLDMRLRAPDLQSVALGRTSSPPPLSMYENCSLTQKQLAPSVEGDDSVLERSTIAPSPPRSGVWVLEPLRGEEWFHGRLSRHDAESRLADSGDFLVRESSSSPGQYVLSGLHGATAKHLLLVDPEGMVRTKDHVFDSVGHLIRYHMDSQRPIVSCGSELCLKQPVLQKQ